MEISRKIDMEDIHAFRKSVQAILDQIDPKDLDYNKDEFWMIESPFQTIEFYASRKHLPNTLIALYLCRGLHDGVHRKACRFKDGVSYRLPYSIHPLMVCRMLIDIPTPLPDDEADVLYAAALCHDMIEDLDFPDHGLELTDKYHLDPRVYETVKYVSKRYDFTPEEQAEFDHNIEAHPLALLVKLCDRGHNVEDLYDRKSWKVHEYVEESRKVFLPMCVYGREHYPNLIASIDILEDKINCLTVAAETLVDRYDRHEQEMLQKLEALRAENKRLRALYNNLWEEKS